MKTKIKELESKFFNILNENKDNQKSSIADIIVYNYGINTTLQRNFENIIFQGIGFVKKEDKKKKNGLLSNLISGISEIKPNKSEMLQKAKKFLNPSMEDSLYSNIMREIKNYEEAKVLLNSLIQANENPINNIIEKDLKNFNEKLNSIEELLTKLEKATTIMTTLSINIDESEIKMNEIRKKEKKVKTETEKEQIKKDKNVIKDEISKQIKDLLSNLINVKLDNYKNI
jgi:hypothetical protein